MPLFLTVQGVRSSTPREEVADVIHHGSERSLNPIVDISHHSRAQFNHENFTGADDRFSYAQPHGIFINLYNRFVPFKGDDFAGEPFFSHINDFIHLGSPHTVRDDNRSCNPPNPACDSHRLCPTFLVCIVRLMYLVYCTVWFFRFPLPLSERDKQTTPRKPMNQIRFRH